MSTGIGWTDETWNPTTGCDRVSPGCDNCYALVMAGRLKRMGVTAYQNDGGERSGPGFRLTEQWDRPKPTLPMEETAPDIRQQHVGPVP